MKHPQRDCVYLEAQACKYLKKDTSQFIDPQIQRYRAEGYPTHNGMVATGVLARKHTPRVLEFCNAWWQELDKSSHRDQLSFNYTLENFKDLDVQFLSWDILKSHFKRLQHR